MKRKRLPNGWLKKCLLSEDLSDLTPIEIAEIFNAPIKSVRKTMWEIKKETGQNIPHVDGRSKRWSIENI